MLNIKILGTGCANCKKLDALVRQVVERMGVQAEIVKVKEYPDIMVYDILSTPGLVIKEKVVVAGRVPVAAEVAAWISESLEIV